MTTVRSVVHPGFVEVTGPGITAVVQAAERHVEALTDAAADGLVALLDLLCSRGLLVLPDFGIVATTDEGARVLVRGAVRVLREDDEVLEADGREPWADLDVVDAGGMTIAAPEPEPVVARGWRRPARLSADPGAAEPGGPGPERVEEDGAPAAGPEPTPTAAAPPADLTLPPPEDVPGAAPVDRVPPSPAPEPGIISSVPWRRGGGPGPAPTPAPAVPPSPPAAPEVPPVAPAAVASAAPADDPQEGVGRPADDDAVLAAAEPTGSGPATASYPAPEATPRPDTGPVEVTTARGGLPRADEDLDRPVVLAVLCPAGHHSAPHAGRCRQCGREIPPQQPAPVPRPPLGVLRISTGGVVPLDRGVLLGRSPRVNEELPPSQRPHLIRVGGADRDISRNHAEVVLEGWHVLVRDLGSTNGTTVALPGEEPVRLRPTEDQGIEPGTVITLADEVSLTYEVEA